MVGGRETELNFTVSIPRKERNVSITTKLTRTLAITLLFALPLLAQGDNGIPYPQTGGGGMFGGNFLFIMAAMIAIIYFVMIRPEQKRQKERVKMLSALKKGDKVLTIGGIFAVIQTVKDNSYVVKSGEGAVLEITKSAVQNLIVESGVKDGVVKEMDAQVKGDGK
jgi:preprotein translocase subunit YajC